MADGVIGRLARILHEESDGEVGVDGDGIDHSERIVRMLIAELREPGDAMIAATCDGDDSWGSCVSDDTGRHLWRTMIDFILNEPPLHPPTDKYETFRVPVEIWRAMYQGGSWLQRNAKSVEPDCRIGEDRPPRDIGEEVWQAYHRGRQEARNFTPFFRLRSWTISRCGCTLFDGAGPCRQCGQFTNQISAKTEVVR